MTATTKTGRTRARETLASRWRERPAVTALTASVVILPAVYGAALLYLHPASPGRQLSLDTLVRGANEKQVRTARLLDEDARIAGTLLGPDGKQSDFWASYPRSDAATNDLLKAFFAAGTKVNVDAQSSKAIVRFVAQFLLPLVILANLFALLFYGSRTVSGGASGFLVFGRVGDKRLTSGDKPPTKPPTRFADVASSEEVTELAEVRDYLADRSSFQETGALPPKGRRLENPDADLAPIARHTAGFTDADLANVVNEAALLAVRWRASAVGRHHLEEAVDRGDLRPRRAAKLIPAKDKRRSARPTSWTRCRSSLVVEGSATWRCCRRTGQC